MRAISDAQIRTFINPRDESYARNRPLQLMRVCSCGCDNRDHPTMIGYLTAITDGAGFTITIDDEETYAHIADILEEAL